MALLPLAFDWSKRHHYKMHKGFVSIKLCESWVFVGRALLCLWKWLCQGFTSKSDSRGAVVLNSIFSVELMHRHMQTHNQHKLLKAGSDACGISCV